MWALVCLLGCALASPAAADDEAYLRVIAQRAPVKSGPGPAYRTVYRAERGDVFTVVERGTKGYWFRVALDDGTTGWIYGELVYPFEVVDDEEPGFFSRLWRGTREALLGPSPVPYSDVEISVSAGVLTGEAAEGLFLLRPAWMLDSYFALEGFFGLSPRGAENLFLAGAGWTLRLLPGADIGPYAHAGVGVAYAQPTADNAIADPETDLAMSVGGGFEITFKRQITLRLDFRNWTIFDPDRSNNSQEYSGGLAIYF